MREYFVAYRLFIDYSSSIGNNQCIINWEAFIIHRFDWCYRLVTSVIEQQHLPCTHLRVSRKRRPKTKDRKLLENKDPLENEREIKTAQTKCISYVNSFVMVFDSNVWSWSEVALHHGNSTRTQKTAEYTYNLRFRSLRSLGGLRFRGHHFLRGLRLRGVFGLRFPHTSLNSLRHTT